MPYTEYKVLQTLWRCQTLWGKSQETKQDLLNLLEWTQLKASKVSTALFYLKILLVIKHIHVLPVRDTLEANQI